ncbi:hypothetical protein DTO166G4_1838 [Paecilomyces variotii]|nr:hypothetical protein DTO166G4_1838 [Paecilomyces variotii]KAJ9239594.1 hypothetical protein DTO166G5_2341 [Paecilomyces variotii]KAJ9246980.1 hypothetical protein DTO207G8_8440 [Paecilomyces variotii]KAJ9355789.1 hypothetical protein DTO027B9_3943 [Paecilomyces variotii]KAJ9374698.1 hypothetical protein DTO282E5_781 [Paecilomyces variotii]
MAAPADVTVQNLNGIWVMDSSLSTPTEPILQLQGMSWITRKALSYATVTLYVTQHPDSDIKSLMHIDIDQTVTGGIKGTSEKRSTDWNEREHKDHIFGSVVGQSRLVRGSKGEDGKLRPKTEYVTKIGGNGVDDEKIQKFLNGEILPDGTESEGWLLDAVGDDFGEGEGLFLQNWVRNVDQGYGWTAEQIWGFENINGKRYYTRRVVVAAKDGSYQLGRLVYNYQGPNETAGNKEQTPAQ